VSLQKKKRRRRKRNLTEIPIVTNATLSSKNSNQMLKSMMKLPLLGLMIRNYTLSYMTLQATLILEIFMLKNIKKNMLKKDKILKMSK